MGYLVLEKTTLVDQDAMFVEPASTPKISLMKGAPIPDWPRVVVAANDPWPPLDWFGIGGIDLVSERVATRLSAIEPRVQLLPVAVNRRGGDPTMPYACVNPLDLPDALDRENAVYEEKWGTVIVKRVALRADVLREAEQAGRAFFAVGQTATRIYVVRDDLAAWFIEAGVTGIRPVRPKDWRSAAYG